MALPSKETDCASLSVADEIQKTAISISKRIGWSGLNMPQFREIPSICALEVARRSKCANTSATFGNFLRFFARENPNRFDYESLCFRTFPRVLFSIFGPVKPPSPAQLWSRLGPCAHDGIAGICQIACRESRSNQ